jgi:hypothetical protein
MAGTKVSARAAASPTRPRPLREAELSQVRVVLTDVDGTLTTKGLLLGSTIDALAALRDAGIRVGLVSGRPAGWGECWARTLPVEAVVVENGGLTFVWREGRLVKRYAEPDGERERNRARLRREIARVMKEFPEARLSSDSAYTEVDIAIDHNEEVKLPPGTAREIEALLQRRGVKAVRSSVHVNCWLGDFDKRSASFRLLSDEWGLRPRPSDARVVYAGDSFNDAPMFEAVRLSVGVANVRAVLGEIACAPAYVTRAEEGHGFEELARAILAQRRERRGRVRR